MEEERGTIQEERGTMWTDKSEFTTIMKFDQSIIAGEDKIKAMDVEIEDIKAQILLLEERVRKVQQEKSQLEDGCSKCKEKKSGIVSR
ncbi:hypothetical protein MTR_8g018140 [Medicago truncatula]|uniref:Uncharacterized protein n=1 Tax=Medicago truncatula TaxID=3880 RepID=G7LI72_MEDTR|nr:hypothetical protein MTR_8g018140 [Medicago truncatula]